MKNEFFILEINGKIFHFPLSILGIKFHYSRSHFSINSAFCVAMRSSTHSLVAYEKCSTLPNFCCDVAILGKIIYMLLDCIRKFVYVHSCIIYPRLSFDEQKDKMIYRCIRVKAIWMSRVAYRVSRIALMCKVISLLSTFIVETAEIHREILANCTQLLSFPPCCIPIEKLLQSFCDRLYMY